MRCTALRCHSVDVVLPPIDDSFALRCALFAADSRDTTSWSAEGSCFACRDSYCAETILIKMKLSLLAEFPDKTRFKQPPRGLKNRKAYLERELIRFILEIVAREATSWMSQCYGLKWIQLLLLSGNSYYTSSRRFTAVLMRDNRELFLQGSSWYIPRYSRLKPRRSLCIEFSPRSMSA